MNNITSKIQQMPLFLYQSVILILLFVFIISHFHNFSSHHNNQTTLEPNTTRKRQHHLFGCTNRSNVKIKNGVDCWRIEKGLARSRKSIREAARTKIYHDLNSNKVIDNTTFIPRGSVYRNPYAFHQSFIEMNKRFRVWVYKEGEPPLFHSGPVKDIYSIEGQFIDELEMGISPFLARNPDDANVFFIPISMSRIVRFLYDPPRISFKDYLQSVITDYINVVSNKYPYWNRSNGADHFFVSCHDWAPQVSYSDPKLFRNLIKVLCNANTSEGFQPARDVTLPEINIFYSSLIPPMNLGLSPKNRSIFAFFVGGHHGHVRETLFGYWKNKDSDVQVLESLSKDQNYYELMGNSKFCLCPSGYEVASPRLVESIVMGCVPVIISANYSLPFSDVLDWSKFSVSIPLVRIPEIKNILKTISMDEYLEKQKFVMQVQPHFLLHRPAQPFDILQMIFHSIWLRRLNIIL